jgi:hypothetical protein
LQRRRIAAHLGACDHRTDPHGGSGRRRLGGGHGIQFGAKRPGDPSARADRSVNLDVGETVMIDSWNADGTSQR